MSPSVAKLKKDFSSGERDYKPGRRVSVKIKGSDSGFTIRGNRDKKPFRFKVRNGEVKDLEE